MDSLTLILAALTAGVTAGGQAIVTDTIKDAYTGLKTLIQRKFVNKPVAEVALTQYETDPQTWTPPLKKALTEEQVDQDATIRQAAQQLLDLIKAQPNGERQVQQVMSAVGSYIAMADHGSTASVNINHPLTQQPE